MSDGIYVGMNGATARLAQLDAIADNLANAETPGFRASRPVFEVVMPKEPHDKWTTAAAGTGVDLRPGPAVSTGRPLDVRPADGMYLAVRSTSGEVSYTRDGRLLLEPDGRMTIGGRPVLGEGGGEIFVPPDSQVRLDPRGRVLVNGEVLDRLPLFALTGRVERTGPALLRPERPEAVQRIVPEERQLNVGELDGSNYPALHAALDMVTAQRGYETAMQAIDAYKRLDELANSVGRPRG